MRYRLKKLVMNNGYLVLIASAVLLVGCKKETRTSEEWRELAETRFKQLEALVATIPCSQQNEAVIERVAQYCGESYFPVTPAIKAKFNQLREAYEQASRQQWRSFNDEGGVIDCFGRNPRPIRIACENDQLLVYTVRNLPMEEAGEMATDLHTKIKQYKDTVSCAGKQQWGIEVVRNLESDELDVLPLRYGDGSGDWADIFSDYQVLVYRLWEAAGTETYPRLAKHPIGVSCVDGKPVIEYEEE